MDTGLGVPRPKFLYHYTPPEALIKIIESGQLWATDVRFLNDPSERIHTRRMAQQIIKKMQRGETCVPNADPVRYQSIIDKMFAPQFFHEWIWDEFKLYAVCFCEDGDLLTQWRGYSQSGSGFSIGFETHALSGIAVEDGGLLRKANYDEDDQNERLVRSLIGHCDIFDENHSAPNAGYICATSWHIDCESYSAYFKNRAFASEKEWRLVYRSPLLEPESLFFRSGRYPVIPYVKPKFQRLPIVSITIGPTQSPALTSDALRQLLRRNSYADVKVRCSDVPLV